MNFIYCLSTIYTKLNLDNNYSTILRSKSLNFNHFICFLKEKCNAVIKLHYV